ncbi:MAG: hypothetical protein ACRYFS_07045 [Janthinobacterium lividum]
MTQEPNASEAHLDGAGKRPSKRVAAGLLFALAVVVILLLVTFVQRPQQPLPFGTLHPHTQQVFRQLGIEPQRVTQGLGISPASAGIHGADGYVKGRLYCAAFDLSVSDLTPQQTRSLLHKLRSVGFVCWWRVPGISFPVTTANGIETGPHIHGIDPFVPHKQRLEMQIRDYAAGNNGIEVGRYAHRPDPAASSPQTAAERRLLYRAGGSWHLRSFRGSHSASEL